MRLVAVLALAAGLTVGPGVDPVSAHSQSPLAGFTCAYTRGPGQAANTTIIEAHVSQMGPGWIKVQCESTNLLIWCSWYAYNNSTLGISGPFNQFCGDI